MFQSSRKTDCSTETEKVITSSIDKMPEKKKREEKVDTKNEEKVDTTKEEKLKIRNNYHVQTRKSKNNNYITASKDSIFPYVGEKLFEVGSAFSPKCGTIFFIERAKKYGNIRLLPTSFLS